MISQEQIRQVAMHGTMHRMGMCACPCYQALVDVGNKLIVENALRLRMARESPELLAGLIIGAAEAEGGFQVDRERGEGHESDPEC